MDYICKRKNNIQSISITADSSGPRDEEGSQLTPHALPAPLKGLTGSSSLAPVCPGYTQVVWRSPDSCLTPVNLPHLHDLHNQLRKVQSLKSIS